MKLGIYVGSFNPVHNGHKYVVDYVLKNKYVDKVIMIPTGNYWNKNDLIDISDRAMMLKFYEDDNIIIDEEVGKYQYTYEVLRHLKAIYPNDTLYLIIGADNIVNFHLWKNYDEILQNMVIILPREGIDIEKHLAKFDNKDHFVIANDFKEVDISSTQIRNYIKSQEIDELLKFLDKMVINYIIDNQLYMEDYE